MAEQYIPYSARGGGGGGRVLIGGSALGGVYVGSTTVSGNASLGANTVVDGDLFINGELTNPGGYTLSVSGDLFVLSGINFTPSTVIATAAVLTVTGDTFIGPVIASHTQGLSPTAYTANTSANSPNLFTVKYVDTIIDGLPSGGGETLTFTSSSSNPGFSSAVVSISSGTITLSSSAPNPILSGDQFTITGTNTFILIGSPDAGFTIANATLSFTSGPNTGFSSPLTTIGLISGSQHYVILQNSPPSPVSVGDGITLSAPAQAESFQMVLPAAQTVNPTLSFGGNLVLTGLLATSSSSSGARTTLVVEGDMHAKTFDFTNPAYYLTVAANGAAYIKLSRDSGVGRGGDVQVHGVAYGILLVSQGINADGGDAVLGGLRCLQEPLIYPFAPVQFSIDLGAEAAGTVTANGGSLTVFGDVVGKVDDPGNFIKSKGSYLSGGSSNAGNGGTITIYGLTVAYKIESNGGDAVSGTCGSAGIITLYGGGCINQVVLNDGAGLGSPPVAAAGLRLSGTVQINNWDITNRSLVTIQPAGRPVQLQVTNVTGKNKLTGGGGSPDTAGVVGTLTAQRSVFINQGTNGAGWSRLAGALY
jgi:hypothetical protein